jgi:HPt (histidine-containing phosphotransfer) domain-containing protein
MSDDDPLTRDPTDREAEAESDGQLDHDELVEQLGGDLDMAKELVSLFLGEWPGEFEKVRRGVDSGAVEEVRIAAHTLKGVIGNFSRGPSMHTAGKLEAIARSGSLAGTAELVTALDRQLRALDADLRRFLASKPR